MPPCALFAACLCALRVPRLQLTLTDKCVQAKTFRITHSQGRNARPIVTDHLGKLRDVFRNHRDFKTYHRSRYLILEDAAYRREQGPDFRNGRHETGSLPPFLEKRQPQ